MDRVLDLRLDCLANFRFHVRLEIVLPLLAAPDETPGPPERKFLLEQSRSLLRALTASLFHAPQESRDLPQGLVFAHLKKFAHASEMFFVAQDCLHGAADFFRQFLEDNPGRARRRLQFQHPHAGFSDHAIDLFFQRAESTLLPKPFRIQTRRAREQRFPGGNGKDRRREAKFLHGRVLEMAMNDLDFRSVAQIGLLQNEDDILEPFFLHEFQQVPRGLRPRIDHRENEEHQVRARHKILGDGLVLGHHRVGARRIHDVEVAQKWNRQITLRELRRDLDRFFLGAETKDVNAIRRRENVDFRKFLAKERVQQRGFSSFDLADHDKEKRLPDIGE